MRKRNYKTGDTLVAEFDNSDKKHYGVVENRHGMLIVNFKHSLFDISLDMLLNHRQLLSIHKLQK